MIFHSFFVSCRLTLMKTKIPFFSFYNQNEVRKSVYRKRRQLKLAFDLVCEKLNNETVLKFEGWKSLMQVLCPSYSVGKVSLLWHVLDRENHDYISKHLLNTFLPFDN